MDDAAREALYSKFEAEGVDAVRQNIAAKRYGDAKLSIAQSWLRSKEEADQRNATERALSAADRSATAAERQANYAKKAYYRSNTALWLSAIAIITTAFFALLDFLKP